MGAVETVLTKAVVANNRRMHERAADHAAPNPRAMADVPWNEALEAAYPAIRAEWDAFTTGGGRLPHLRDVVNEDQGADGAWRAGILVSRARPCTKLATRFPRTLAALRGVPGLWSALWSELEPGTELPEHQGPNAGMLRYHLGVDCGTDSALQVGDTVVPYRDGVGILFDDTVPHAAWNRGTTNRITLFLEVRRPASGPTRWGNEVVQRLIALDPRYRLAPARADEWHEALNP